MPCVAVSRIINELSRCASEMYSTSVPPMVLSMYTTVFYKYWRAGSHPPFFSCVIRKSALELHFFVFESDELFETWSMKTNELGWELKSLPEIFQRACSLSNSPCNKGRGQLFLNFPWGWFLQKSSILRTQKSSLLCLLLRKKNNRLNNCMSCWGVIRITPISFKT